MKDLYDVGEQPPLGEVPARMHAWVVRPERFGEPRRSFQREVIPTPSIGDDEVLVYVMAAGVNYNNVWAGLGVPVDVIADRRRKGEPEDYHVGGSDASGIVHQVGRDVKDLHVGDEVVVHCGSWSRDCPTVRAGADPMFSPTFRIWGYETNHGSFAQFTRVQAHQCLPRPRHLTWEAAAAYMLVGATAYRMLRGWPEHALEQGDVVLVWGGAGGLGSMAIQIARARGAIPVAVVSSDDKIDYCMSLGAKGCINRKRFDHWGMLPHWKDKVGYATWLKGVRSFGKAIWDVLGEKRAPKLVFEHPGEDTIPTSMFVCETGGAVVICAGTTGYNATVDLRYLWMRQKRLQGSHFANDEQAAGINDLVIEGQVDPCLSRSFAFDELPDSHQLMYENRHPHGNMAVLIGAPRLGLGATAASPARASISSPPLPGEAPDVIYARPRGRPGAAEPAVLGTATVAEFMHQGVITCRPDEKLPALGRRMVENQIHALVVVGEDGAARGVVSQTDLVLAWQGRSPDAYAALRATDAMSHDLKSCTPATPLSDAITTMTRHNIHRLVVTASPPSRPVPLGILTMTDIVKGTGSWGPTH